MKRTALALTVVAVTLAWSWQVAAQNGTDFGVPGENFDGPAAPPAVEGEQVVQGSIEDGSPENYLQQGSKEDGALSANAADAVWALIDANEDARATDKEVFDARRDLRRLANHPESTPVRDVILERYDADDNGQLDVDESFVCLSEVRGDRCPTAARAREYCASIDSDGNGAVEPEEFYALLRPLGRVGEAMAGLLDGTLDAIDRDDNDRIEELEVNRRANAVLLIQLATTGDNISGRDPGEWIRYVAAVAQLDYNADNVVSPQEASAIGQLARHFGRADSNSDQTLTVSELCDYKDQFNAQVAGAGSRTRFSSGSC